MAGDSPRPCFFTGGKARETLSHARVAGEGPRPTERTAPSLCSKNGRVLLPLLEVTPCGSEFALCFDSNNRAACQVAHFIFA